MDDALLGAAHEFGLSGLERGFGGSGVVSVCAVFVSGEGGVGMGFEKLFGAAGFAAGGGAEVSAPRIASRSESPNASKSRSVSTPASDSTSTSSSNASAFVCSRV